MTVGAVAIAIALSGALVALLSLGSVVNFDDWPQPPDGADRSVRPGANVPGEAAARDVRPANLRSLSDFIGPGPSADAAGTTLIASLPPGGTLQTTDVELGGVAVQRRQVTRLQSPRRRSDRVKPAPAPAPPAPAPGPAPPTPPRIPVVDRPDKGEGRGPSNPPGQGRPRQTLAPKPQKPSKPNKPDKPNNPGGGKPGGGPRGSR